MGSSSTALSFFFFFFLYTAEAQLPPGGVPAPIILNTTVTARSLYILNARFRPHSHNCGGGIISRGWQIAQEHFWFRPQNITDNTIEFDTLGGYFNTTSGRFRAPINGIYYISAWARCETQGCDISIRANFDRVAAFGTDLVNVIEGHAGNTGRFWSSHGVGTLVFLRAGQFAYLRHESGNSYPPTNNYHSGDCIFDTNFHYGQFNVFLYLPTVGREDALATLTG